MMLVEEKELEDKELMDLIEVEEEVEEEEVIDLQEDKEQNKLKKNPLNKLSKRLDGLALLTEGMIIPYEFKI